MERIDIELYADRLVRHAERLADDIGAARVRLAWRDLEERARARLTDDDRRALEAVGVLADPGAPTDDAATLERRRIQLTALGRLQALVEEELAAARRRGQAQPGATATSTPPSSS